MNKKALTILLMVSLSITGLFAYSVPTVILSTDVDEINYNFKLQKLNSAMNDYTDLSEDYTETVILDSTERETNAFTVSTANDGNLHDETTFYVNITTGEFIDKTEANDYIYSGWYPTIIELSESATESNKELGSEVLNYVSGTNGNYTAASTATFSNAFSRGVHEEGVEIARFKLGYKGDNSIVAGTYTSTTIIEITAN